MRYERPSSVERRRNRTPPTVLLAALNCCCFLFAGIEVQGQWGMHDTSSTKVLKQTGREDKKVDAAASFSGAGLFRDGRNLIDSGLIRGCHSAKILLSNKHIGL
jgi:hypothetical protein